MNRKLTASLVIMLILAMIMPRHMLEAKAQGTVSVKKETTFFASHLKDVIYANKQYVAVGDEGTILHSDNGTEWSFANSGVKGTLQSVAYGNGSFVAVGDDNIVLTSKDGRAWKKQSFSPQNLTVLASARYKPKLDQDHITTSTGVVWDGKRFVMHTEFVNYTLSLHNEITYSRVPLISTSADGIKWSTVQIYDHMHDPIGKIKYLKGVYYLFSDGAVLSSKDLKKWSTIALEDVRDAALGPKGYVLGLSMLESPYFFGRTMLVPGIQSTVDTSKSEKIGGGNVSGVRSVDYANGTYIVHTYSGVMANSKDGEDWEMSRPFDSWGETESKMALYRTHASKTALNKTIWDGKRYITVGDYGILLYSSDLKTFDKASIKGVKMMSGSDLKGIKYEHGLYYTYGSNGTLLISEDGANWDYFEASRDISSSYTVEDAAFNGNDFAVVTGYSQGFYSDAKAGFLSSSGGSIIEEIDSLPHEVKWNGKTFRAYFKFEEVYELDQANGEWKSIKERGNLIDTSVKKVAGNGNTVKYTELQTVPKNGLGSNPTKAQLEKYQWFIQLHYLENGKWKESNYHLFNTYELARIKYEVQWDHWSNKDLSINGIVYGNNEFFAVGSGGLILQSKDGKAWKKLNSGTYMDLNGIVWDGEKYLIVGERGTFLTYSPFQHMKRSGWAESAYSEMNSAGKLPGTLNSAYQRPITREQMSGLLVEGADGGHHAVGAHENESGYGL